MVRNIILGAGAAGLGASYALNQKGESSLILEKDSTYGGLLGNFSIKGFRFDRFVHFSFTSNPTVNKIFEEGSPEIIRHIPNPFNIYNRLWIKHPAQNNLFPLPQEEKDTIISDFEARPNIENKIPKNYEEWLRWQFGNCFAERFPMVYTQKYWMSDAKDLETTWVGNRVYQPSLEEVKQGAATSETPLTYYAKEMRYPKKGGFKQYISALAKNANIKYNAEAVEIDWEEKTVKLANGEIVDYDRLISSIPLPLLIKITKNVPVEVKEAASKLRCTSGWQISIGLKGNNIPPYLWWYIYDKDILPARVYSPSMKSPDNVPDGCSSLQLEVYCNENDYTRDELIEKSVNPLIELGALRKEDILFIDTRFEPCANVIFDHNIHNCRKIVRGWLSSVGIKTIGRFGEWDYLWSDQSLQSGLNVVKEI